MLKSKSVLENEIGKNTLNNTSKSPGEPIGLVWFGLVWFYRISTIVGYLMPNPLYTYILNIYDLVWLGFMAYQALWVI